MASASNQNASTGLPKKGDKCHCPNTPFWAQSNCCDEGLVCDKKTWTCMPALGWSCKRKWGATECANLETYSYEYGGGNLMCSHPNPHGESFCCIKSGEYAFYERPDRSKKANEKPFRDPGMDCCSGRWKRSSCLTRRSGMQSASSEVAPRS
eukprot:Skav216920  [mRNA]  locus=scaffold1838:154038:154493:- [translate_table: standard]